METLCNKYLIDSGVDFQSAKKKEFTELIRYAAWEKATKNMDELKAFFESSHSKIFNDYYKWLGLNKIGFSWNTPLYCALYLIENCRLSNDVILNKLLFKAASEWCSLDLSSDRFLLISYQTLQGNYLLVEKKDSFFDHMSAKVLSMPKLSSNVKIGFITFKDLSELEVITMKALRL